jgi:hypothetical protein
MVETGLRPVSTHKSLQSLRLMDFYYYISLSKSKSHEKNNHLIISFNYDFIRFMH